MTTDQRQGIARLAGYYTVVLIGAVVGIWPERGSGRPLWLTVISGTLLLVVLPCLVYRRSWQDWISGGAPK